ncbi:fumarylacetoacetate hydrolase family protein [Clostridium sp. AM58-1XD]|uniref:fumarylacetoacetate hydrolase family protein n=1 Tax=Clostridium sp. AM58-1XD TaxID=2292307 RepID=UPI000E50F781|nr:fumarylacetoacetate hydrolase family protein [Clostridium sp. AM58-1XD]RGY97696.1 FAA hydrolase family protein [Clostridium sp. AM58-1XD]
MRLLTIKKENGYELGVKLPEGILNVTECLKKYPTDYVPGTMEEVIGGGGKALTELNRFITELTNEVKVEFTKDEERVEFGPCVPNPGKIIGIGLNYQAVLEESNGKKPVFPHLFNKFSDSVVGHKGVVTIPANSNEVDYEAELAIVIGKRARLVSEEEALDYVLGYCNTNDISARDFQYSTTSWIPGKCCDNFCPIGPYIVTKDEVPDPNNLALRGYVNGELRQDHNTSDMIFNCRAIISGISKYFTLKPGDVILTGTSGGIILTYPEDKRVWLKEGDILEVEMGNLGRLVNIVKKEVL